LLLLKAGTGSYQNPDVSGTSRWGDYSATSLDPADPTRFWTIQMIPVSRSSWKTQITELLTGASNTVQTLSLNAIQSGSNLIITWPTNAPASQLQFKSLLSTTNWLPVSQAVVTTNGVASVIVPATGDAGFFRLAPISASP
jgi:hypothetical protein